MRIEIILS